MKISLRRRSIRTAVVLALASACATIALPAGGGGERGPQRHPAAAVAAPTEARVIVKYKADSSLLQAAPSSGTAALPQHARALGARLGINLADGRAIGARAQVVKASGLGPPEPADR